MLMVIFGAGASYDLDRRIRPDTGRASVKSRLPLAAQLFDDRFSDVVPRYAACQALMPRLRAAKGDIESQLERFSAESIHHQYRARQLNAVRYYIRDVISKAQDSWRDIQNDGVTNYVELLDAIEWWRKNEPVCLVTFNYDTLLELACQSVLQRPLDSIDAYVGDDRMLIFKLHGSTGWYQELQYLSSRGVPTFKSDLDRDLWLIEHTGPNLEPTGAFGLYGSAPVLNGRFPGAAVSVPFATKTPSSFNCPTNHVLYLMSIMPRVTHLLVIGWRGREAHFHKCWNDATGRIQPPQKSPLVKTLVVDRTPQSASDVLDTLREAMALGDGEVSAIGGGFSGFIKSDGLAKFLG